MAELIIKLGDTVLQTHPFDGDLLRIGRSRENDIVLDNLSVSRHHVQIRFHEGQYVLFDMNSSNGTFLNGTRVTRRELLDGDQITIGKHVLVWHDTAEQSTVLDEKMPPPPEEDQGLLRQPDARAAAWIKVDSGKLKGREFKVVRFETSLGKAANNDIVLTDDWLLSKKQAIILRKGNDEFEIQDLGGLRRVKVNGKVVEKSAPLRTGDKLELGGTRLVFFSTAVDHPSTPAQFLLKDPEPQVQHDDHSETSGPAALPAVSLPAAAQKDEKFDHEDLLEPASLVARELENKANGQVKPQEAPARASSNGSVPHAIPQPAQRTAPPVAASSGRKNPADVAASAEPAQPSRAAAQQAEPTKAAASNPEIKPGPNDKEIKMWESAINNPSPAIRRQAARMLKKLTGRDYDI